MMVVEDGSCISLPSLEARATACRVYVFEYAVKCFDFIAIGYTLQITRDSSVNGGIRATRKKGQLSVNACVGNDY